MSKQTTQPIDLDDEPPTWGPCMTALANDRQRAFVCALFNAPKAKGRYAYAVRAAKYGTPTSSRKSLSVIAARLSQDERVRAAIEEESRRRLRALPPTAISALERLIDKPDHKDHARAISMVLERSDPVQTSHNVSVSHNHEHRISVEDIAKTRQRIQELAKRAGLLPPPAAEPVVDAEFTVVDGGAAP